MRSLQRHFSNKFRFCYTADCGFSLLELLVVLAIVSLLAVLGVVGMGGKDSSKLQSAQGVLIGQIQAARNMALARNEPCRLLIEAGAESGQRLGIATLSPSNTWELCSPMVELAQGTAVLVGDGGTPTTTRGGSPAAPPVLSSGQLTVPPSLSGKDWYYFEFDPAGTSEANAGAILVLGSVRPDGTGYTRKSEEAIRGVMIRRTGHVSAFEDPSHIREAFESL